MSQVGPAPPSGWAMVYECSWYVFVSNGWKKDVKNKKKLTGSPHTQDDLAIPWRVFVSEALDEFIFIYTLYTTYSYCIFHPEFNFLEHQKSRSYCRRSTPCIRCNLELGRRCPSRHAQVRCQRGRGPLDCIILLAQYMYW